MRVVEDKQKILLNLRNPERVLAAVPDAEIVRRADTTIVACPHSVQAVSTLRTLGFDAPAPILHQYDWPGRFKPYEHQRQTAAFATLHHKCIILNQIGTGKSLSALWAADYLMNIGAIKKVLILSPLSTLERVWKDSVFLDISHRDAVVLHGSAARRHKLLEQDVDFYIINHDGFRVIADAAHGMFDLVIIDEAAVLRNARTNRYKAFNTWYRSQSREPSLWLMTGTPTPNEPTDAWSLARLLDNPLAPKTYSSFRDRVMVRKSMYSWGPRPEAPEIVSRILQPSIIYKREDCFDLPDTVVNNITVDLTAEQAKHFKTMVSTMLVEVDSGQTITAVNEAVKLQKLVQILCGVAYNDDGENVEIDCKPRVDAVCEIIEQAGGKAIVFVPLTGTIKMLERELSKRWSVGVVNGNVSASKRGDIFGSFQQRKDPHVLLAHPATMAHGLTLTEASTVIWYGPITSNEQYVQANGRVERIGKKHVSYVVHITATELERKMFRRLDSKQKLQGILLDLLEQERRTA